MPFLKGHKPTKTCEACRAKSHPRTAVCPCGVTFPHKEKGPRPSRESMRRLNKGPKLKAVKEPEGGVAAKGLVAKVEPPAASMVELVVPGGVLPRYLSPPKELIEGWVRDIKAYYLAQGRLLTYSAAQYVLKTETGYILGELARDKPELFQQTLQ